jgi:hypothetical protein
LITKLYTWSYPILVTRSTTNLVYTDACTRRQGRKGEEAPPAPTSDADINSAKKSHPMRKRCHLDPDSECLESSRPSFTFVMASSTFSSSTSEYARIVFLDELVTLLPKYSDASAQHAWSMGPLRISGCLAACRLSTRRAVIEDHNVALMIDTTLLDATLLVPRKQIQVFGLIELLPDSETSMSGPPLSKYILRATLIRDIDALDLNLYRKAVQLLHTTLPK